LDSSNNKKKELPVLSEICWVGYDLPLHATRKKYEELKIEGEGRTCGGGSDNGYVGSRTLHKHNTFYVSSCAIIAPLQTT